MTSNTNPTQCAAILCELRARRGWVYMPSLVVVSGAYAVHSRIAELRRRGHKIECKIETCGRVKHSFYRLTEQAA